MGASLSEMILIFCRRWPCESVLYPACVTDSFWKSALHPLVTLTFPFGFSLLSPSAVCLHFLSVFSPFLHLSQFFSTSLSHNIRLHTASLTLFFLPPSLPLSLSLPLTHSQGISTPSLSSSSSSPSPSSPSITSPFSPCLCARTPLPPIRSLGSSGGGQPFFLFLIFHSLITFLNLSFLSYLFALQNILLASLSHISLNNISAFSLLLCRHPATLPSGLDVK